ncbi:hypothetical protein EV421DRAFT_1913100 [Armillaria borealis]|uniref:Uncharacterized protein n=1 Tax=Armillaria borealis TaxID=47425 RepID=A0AA39ME86_9AGAR|nr:hypothetical protein EV421DRAFT_1913100 [Armillaria borealis]
MAKTTLEAAMAKKVLDDLAKAKEKAKEKKDEDNEKLLVAAGIVPSGEERDSESDPVDRKTVAMAKLRKRCRIAEGKKKAGSMDSWKRKFQLASVVESGEDGNALVGLLGPKHLKTEHEPMAQDKVFTGSGHCGKCHTNKAICFVHGGVHMCQRCHVKKVRCTFNKGGEDSGTAESPSILESLQDISSRLTYLEDKVEAIMGHMEDLVDDYNVDNKVKYSEDFIPKSIKAKFEASQMEL